MDILKQNIINQYGDRGKQWLSELPLIVDEMARNWNLSNLQPINNLSYHYLLSGFQETYPIVLKLGLDVKDLSQEANALKAFSGYGVVKLLEATNGALLLERAIPGTTLKTLFPHHDSKAINIACELIDTLHKAPIPAYGNFPMLKDWLTILDKEWDLPQNYLTLARKLRDKLLASSTSLVLLHGDLHHDNILLNHEKWVIIDPKGVIGDPICAEISCLIRKPLVEFLQQKDRLAILQRRIQLVSDYSNIDSTRLIQWTFVHSVLACCWHLEDKQNPALVVNFLEILINML